MKSAAARAILWLALALGGTTAASAEVRVQDADRATVKLSVPAHRVVALSPHLSEVVFAVGAGGALVAVSDHSDWPEAARRLPRVGDAFDVQLEAVLARRPDLVLVWGASGHALSRAALARAGVALYVSRPVHLADVADDLRAIAHLLGRDAEGMRAAQAYLAQLDAARRAGAASRPTGPLRVFLQMGAPELYTVGDAHYLGEALRLCGAVNVFGELTGNAPRVSMEAALARRPRVVLALADIAPRARAMWHARGVADVRTLPQDALSRPGPRLAAGVAGMCRLLHDA